MVTDIKIIYDNEAEKGYISGWGFAAIIKHNEKTILFDAGWSGPTLLRNLQTAGINPKKIDIIVISHKHWDHLGGLDSILAITTRPLVYVPMSFSSKLKIEILNYGELREVTKKNFEKIIPGVFTTPVLETKTKDLDEISLVIETKNGLLILCGCSHPGLDKIIDVVKRKGKIHSVIGGFHGFNKLRKLSEIQLIVPCHCTKLKNEIIELYPKNSRRCFAGAEYHF
jgi:7,8-dihydropterin-6-yl-methyl-4-(beta-D-ribofuranosyl)aminobenzene 5'-phosphate synthase